MIPQRGSFSSPEDGAAKKVKSVSFHFSPEAFTSSNSLFLFSLFAAVFEIPEPATVAPFSGSFTDRGTAFSALQRSESKSLASFLSATGEDLTAFFGCHSGTESAFAVSAQH